VSRTTGLCSRAYVGDVDLHRLVEFLVDCGSADQSHTGWHIGNLLWSLYYSTDYAPGQNVRIWESAQRLVAAFAWFEEPNSIELQIHPRLHEQKRLKESMLAWAEERARACAGPGWPRLTVTVPDRDSGLITFLRSRGFEPEQLRPSSTRLRQDLQRTILPASLPAGWTVRPVADESEWKERVDIHREVWHPSRMTVEAYRRLRSAPGYLPDLDLVVVAPDGIFASYAICWLDQVNGTGLFEPVGTRPAYRRRGLGAALLTASLRRLQEYGARTALVQTSLRNKPAIHLYETVGFQNDGTESHYRKRL
jgi:GNAT superfamily N-acetyltransferase